MYGLPHVYEDEDGSRVLILPLMVIRLSNGRPAPVDVPPDNPSPHATLASPGMERPLGYSRSSNAVVSRQRRLGAWR